MNLTHLKEQLSSKLLDSIMSGQFDPFTKKIIESAILWRDGEETVCDQLTIYNKDGGQITYYGFDTFSILDHFHIPYTRENGPSADHLWD